jgi:hypothetical protein
MSLQRVKKLYRDFHEREPTRVSARRFRVPKALAIIGHLDALSYRTVIGWEAQRYKHTFTKGTRPVLATDGKRLFIVGGRFRVTARGIVNLSPTGREQE